MSDTPTFPPLFSGEAVTGAQDPFEKACARAALGCDGGTVVYNIQADMLRAAMVFAPEVALADAMAMLPVCAVGFQNALGALAPPEVAVQFTWPGEIRVNGAGCGRIRAAAAGDDPDVTPDWLVIGVEIPLLLTGVPGENPEFTALYEEGCSEVDPVRLVEAWTRHTLVWINRWDEEGNKPLHTEWMGLVVGVGEDVRQSGISGTFLGVDDRFGMLIRDDAATHLVPMSRLLEGTS